MQTKRRSVASVLAVVIMLVVTVLGFALSKTNTANGSNTFEPIKLDSTDVSAYATSGYEDFSNYTDQELPSSIDRKNISQYVPIDKFNKDGTTIYNGRNYGFVIYSKANTNHVLLFKETYTKTSENKYEVEFKVLYTNKFYKLAGNNITNAYVVDSIALSNVKMSEFIMDVDMQKNIANPAYDQADKTSPYFNGAGLSGDLSFLDKNNTSNNFSITSLEIEPKAKTNEILSYDVADLTVNAVKGQTNSLSATMGEMTYLNASRSIELSVDAGADDFLSFKSENQDYLKASFELGGSFNNNYYIYNNVSFDVCLYSTVSVSHKERRSSQSVFSLNEDTESKYGVLERNSDGYTLTEYQRLTPMLNGDSAFKFEPDKVELYKFTMPEGYYANTGTSESSWNNILTILGYGEAVGITTETGKKASGNLHGERLLAQDFIGGNFTFANIGIARAQELKLGVTTLNPDVPVYREIGTSEINNDLYVLDTMGYDGVVDLHILDEDLNIIQSSTRDGNNIYINYPMLKNKKYYIVCDNKDDEAHAFVFTNKGKLLLGASQYQNIENLYYKYDVPKYTQYYKTFSKRIVDEQGELVSINGDDAFLKEGKTYYLQSSSFGLMTIISNSHVNQVTNFGESVECSLDYNEVFEFIPKASATYEFGEGTYDVYCNWTLIGEDVNSIYLNASEDVYRVVKRQKGGTFELNLGGEELVFGFNYLTLSSANGKNFFVFNSEQNMRIGYQIMPDDNKVYLIDSQFNEYVDDGHGFPVLQGKNYIVIEGTGGCAITIKEFVQEVNIDLYVDGCKYEYDEIFYYGKEFKLPVPEKDGYNFVGWKNGDELITDNEGNSYGELLADYLVLDAKWEKRGVIMEINFDNMTTKWWDGTNIVGYQPSEIIFEGDLFSELIDMKAKFVQLDEGKKEGYFLKTFTYTKSAISSCDYYILYPVWETEKYYIEFMPPYDGDDATSRAVTYGEIITNSIFPSVAFELGNKDLYRLVGWYLPGKSDYVNFALGAEMFDLTPGRGSDYNFDSDGDGIDDSLYITLTPKLEYVEYYVVINNISYNVPQEGYTVQGLGSYGYNEAEYYGRNVLLNTTDKSQQYTFGGKDCNIVIENLRQYWMADSMSVTVNLTLSTSWVRVYLDYYDAETTNPEEYIGADGNVRLSDGHVRGFIFYDWYCNGSTITYLSYSTLGIRQYYSVKGTASVSKYIYPNTSGRTTLKPGSISTTKITDEATLVDCSKHSLMTAMKFIIYPTATEVTFENGYCRDTVIIIEPRSTKLFINMSNMEIMASGGNSVIDATNCPDLELYSFDSVKLTGGEARGSIAGGAAIECRNLTLSGEYFLINGGESVSYEKDGRAGICGAEDAGYKLIIDASTVSVYGGRGCGRGEFDNYSNRLRPDCPSEDEFRQNQAEQGKDGADGANGKRGSDGAVAIYFPGTVIVNSKSSLYCHGGDGGDGQNGGNGQMGGDGVNGSFGSFTVEPGDGGNGGLGGSGGFGAKPMIYGSLEKNGYYVGFNGKGGIAGFYGYGAPAGEPSKTIFDEVKTGHNGHTYEIDGINGLTGVSEAH
ncbi:MAG: hypothetical protein HDT32_06980 [Clostridiales bacterium]|nr:hypothetical protein [Clostridiales bacterium]